MAVGSDSSAFILGKLAELLALLRGRVYVGVAGPPAPPGASFNPAARLNFLLSGRKRICLPLAAGAAEPWFRAGDGHFSPAQTWEFHDWRPRHELLCIVPRAEYLRVSYYRVTRSGQPPETAYYHTNRLPGPAFRHTLRALEAQAETLGEELLPELVTALIRLALEECGRPPAEPADRSARIVGEIRRVIENNFQKNLGRAGLAAQFHLTPSHLSRLFKQVCGQGLQEYLTECRLKFAQNLLLETDLTVYQVARQCGFGNYVHFVRRFRQLHGRPPGRYREDELARRRTKLPAGNSR